MAKSAARIKTPALGHNHTPQDRVAAAAQLARIGELERRLDRLKADQNDSLTRIKEECEKAAQPFRDELALMVKGLQTWCEANRASLTDDGRVKFADLGTGKVEWRFRPPRVSLRDVDAVVERLRRLGLDRFLRVKTEVNKEAMQEEPAVAREVDGVSIGSEGEEFIVKPFAAELEGAAA